MVEPFLIVSVIVVAILIFIMSIITLIKFQHPDDRVQAWCPKFVVVLGFFLIFGVAMLMPYDVANRDGGGIDMDTLWLIGLCSVAAMVLVVVPFAFCYYEAQTTEDELTSTSKRRGCCEKQFMQAVLYTLAFAVVLIVLTVILYATPANTAEVPVHLIQQNYTNAVTACTSTNTFQDFRNINLLNCEAEGGGCDALGTTFNWEISVTFIVYLLALLSFIGWWFFFLFAGVGLVALPFDLINDFRTRPAPMSKMKYQEECNKLILQVDESINQARTLRDGEILSSGGMSQNKRSRTAINKLEQQYYFLRRDFNLLKTSREYSQSNPLWYILKLFLGIIGLVISILWILHICLFMLPGKGNEVDPFLNKLFIDLESVGGGAFPLFGILAYAIFVFYLQWCVVKGNFRLGIRFLVFKMYPMEVGNTYMSAFLANIWILCLCVFPLVQFVAAAIPLYARYTAIEVLFGGQIKYLKGFSVFWTQNVFVYMLLAMAILTIPVVIFCPISGKKELQKKLDAKAAERIRKI